MLLEEVTAMVRMQRTMGLRSRNSLESGMARMSVKQARLSVRKRRDNFLMM